MSTALRYPRDPDVIAWICPHCAALISESIIGDPAHTTTRVRCHECHEMVPLTDSGRWFPEPVAAALVELADVVRDLVSDWALAHSDVEDALAALDAARAQETPTIHPPAHYQIDTSTPGWNTRYVDAVAKEHGWTRAEAQGRIADGGAR